MVTSSALLFLSITITESMAGILGNGIILAACSSSCIRSKILPPYDMIVISLTSSRFILHSWNVLDLVINILHVCSNCEENILLVSNTVYMFLNCSGLWFGAWLSVFYCIKVASFKQSFFIWLKQRIARLVPWTLLTSWLCSIIAAIPFDVVQDNFTAPSSKTNASVMRTTRKDNLGVLILCNAAIGVPLILSVVSNILLIQSLWIHTRRMQSNASGIRDPSLEAHISAIKSVCSFLILYIIYFICFLLLLYSHFLPLSDEESIAIAILAACPTGHTLVLIWSNPKFQDLPARIWHHINCHVRTASM